MVAFMLHEDLGLVLQAPERGRVDDAIAVALERRPRRAVRLGDKSPAAPGRIAGIRGMKNR
jgi:hypothetical protein